MDSLGISGSSVLFSKLFPATSHDLSQKTQFHFPNLIWADPGRYRSTIKQLPGSNHISVYEICYISYMLYMLYIIIASLPHTHTCVIRIGVFDISLWQQWWKTSYDEIALFSKEKISDDCPSSGFLAIFKPFQVHFVPFYDPKNQFGFNYPRCSSPQTASEGPGRRL